MNLANGFAKCGLSVDVVLVRATGPYLSALSPEVRVIELHTKRVMLSGGALFRYLVRERPVSLLSGLGGPNMVAIAVGALFGSSTRVVASIHNNEAEEMDRDPWATRKAVAQFLYPRLLRHSTALVAVSQGVAEQSSRLFGIARERVTVIPNPVITSAVLEKAKEPITESWFGNGQCPVVLGIGRLCDQKDFATLVRACAIVRQRHDIRLIILGEGEKRSELEKLAHALGLSDRAVFPGFVQNPYKFMRNARVVALSSVFEGFGNVLAEAMACGTAVVSTDCRFGPSEILEKGRWGRLVPVGDVPAMAVAIADSLSVLRSPGLVDRGMAFSIERILPQYAQVLGVSQFCQF